MNRVFDGSKQITFSENDCFLCKCTLSEDNRTDEHIFPKWVLREHSLWDTRVTLLNESQIPYRSLVIPCCTACNTGPLSDLENTIATAYRNGIEAFRALDSMDVLNWCIKIYYGLLYREHFLPIDRAAPAETIVSTEDLEQFKTLHLILQSIRRPMTFMSPESSIPGSIFVFNLQTQESDPFDFKDSIGGRCLSLRIGHIGILAAFDLGAQKIEGRDFFSPFLDHVLHPI